MASFSPILIPPLSPIFTLEDLHGSLLTIFSPFSNQLQSFPTNPYKYPQPHPSKPYHKTIQMESKREPRKHTHYCLVIATRSPTSRGQLHLQTSSLHHYKNYAFLDPPLKVVLDPFSNIPSQKVSSF